MSEFDKAFETIEELTDVMIQNYNKLMDIGDFINAEVIKKNFRFYLNGCYKLSFPTDDNIITNDPRYKECCENIALAIESIKS